MAKLEVVRLFKGLATWPLQWPFGYFKDSMRGHLMAVRLFKGLTAWPI